MNTTSLSLPLLGLGCVVAGLVGAVGVGLVLDDGGAAPASSVGVLSPDPSAELLALRTRLEFVEKQNTRFSERIHELEVAAADRDDAELEPRALAAPSEVPRVVEPAAGRAAPDDLVASVDAALETIRAREEAERDAERDARRAERVDERVAELTEQLGLDVYQAGQMHTWLDEVDDARDALRDDLRESGDWGGMRAAFDELRDTAHGKLETFLTPYQVETYDGLTASRWGRGGRGRSGGD